MSLLSDTPMVLELAAMPNEKVPSHYRDGASGFPSRMGFLHPKCLRKFCSMQEASGWNIVLSDGWRAGKASLKRKYPAGKRMRRGVQPPAYSGHNYGFSIDIDVRATMKRMKMSKKQLDVFMAGFGFHCHRKDHRITHEAWHYNALVLGNGPKHWLKFSGRSTSGAVERMIVETYGPFWKPSDKQLQRYLVQLGHYKGAIDGDIGRRSKKAIRAFQKAWHLKVDGVAGSKTVRVLAFRCAELTNPLVKDLWTVKD